MEQPTIERWLSGMHGGYQRMHERASLQFSGIHQCFPKLSPVAASPFPSSPQRGQTAAFPAADAAGLKEIAPPVLRRGYFVLCDAFRGILRSGWLSRDETLVSSWGSWGCRGGWWSGSAVCRRAPTRRRARSDGRQARGASRRLWRSISCRRSDWWFPPDRQ